MPQQPLQAQTLSFCAFSRVGLVQFLDQVIEVPVAVPVRFGVEKETVEASQLQFFSWGSCCSCCSLEFWTLLLEPLADSPSRSVSHQSRRLLDRFTVFSMRSFQVPAVAVSLVWSSFGPGACVVADTVQLCTVSDKVLTCPLLCKSKGWSSTWRCLSFSSSTSGGYFSCYGDRIHSANCGADRRFHGAVLDGRRHARCSTNDRFMVQTLQNCCVPQLQCPDKVVDVLVVAIHRQGVDVPVIL